VGSALHRAIDRALAGIGNARDGVPDAVEKTIWGSPAGKKRIAERLAKLLPAHSTYIEPFAGSAAVLFAKQPSQLEVICDADPDIARAYKVVQGLRAADFDQLRKLDWVGRESTFHKLCDTTPRSDLGFLYKFLYTTHFSYGKMRGKSFSPSSKGVAARTVDRLERFAPRLARVKIRSGDYEPVVRKYDGKRTAMFLDPPYAGYDARVGESRFDEQRFFAMLKSLKGNWVLTYGIRGELPQLLKSAGYDVRTIRTRRSIGSMRNVGGPSVLTQLLATNFAHSEKALAELASDDLVLNAFAPQPPATKSGVRFDRVARLVKGASPTDERFVLGIVLEPETVDSQGDIYSVDEVRNAAHTFMEDFGALGIMHRLRVDGQVKLLESYLAPDDVRIGELTVKRGTWLLGVRVLSDELWAAVRDGTITGFSIGGYARRVPTRDAPSEGAAA
jgi:DNA adenine methylase